MQQNDNETFSEFLVRWRAKVVKMMNRLIEKDQEPKLRRHFDPLGAPMSEVFDHMCRRGHPKPLDQTPYPNPFLKNWDTSLQREKKRMSWTWFLLQLIKDVNASSKRTLTFISDEQKGLVLTFEEVFGGMEHRLCVRHMYNNFKKKFPGIHLKDLFWRIASASYEKQWERAMKELKEVDRLAFEWVESKPKEKWCKHKCKVHSKCDTLVNNMCELFNEPKATASAHSGSNAHAQSKASVHGHSTASATATARISSASSIARANVETSPSVPPEVKRSKNKGKSIVTSRGRIQPRVSNLPLPKIYGPPPSWRLQASISRETLMATSQSARYREAFHILGS
uniref:MULE transposase domain-containing protein n=1 Tax=Fagus sylvatica TaxID=28930 RepID=A0A2N9H685_FAGSY